MAAVGQRVYIVGGFNSRMYLHTVDCFDVARARWSAKANMACERCHVCVVALQGHVYAMGGFDGYARTNTV